MVKTPLITFSWGWNYFPIPFGADPPFPHPAALLRGVREGQSRGWAPARSPWRSRLHLRLYTFGAVPAGRAGLGTRRARRGDGGRLRPGAALRGRRGFSGALAPPTGRPRRSGRGAAMAGTAAARRARGDRKKSPSVAFLAAFPAVRSKHCELSPLF